MFEVNEIVRLVRPGMRERQIGATIGDSFIITRLDNSGYNYVSAKHLKSGKVVSGRMPERFEKL